MLAKDRLGQSGERLARKHLIDSGFLILDSNWRCPIGELDIVAREGTKLVFCEVKTRSSTLFGDPIEAIDEAKARRIHLLAARWIGEHRVVATSVRYDVIAVLAPRGQRPEITHLRDAF